MDELVGVLGWSSILIGFLMEALKRICLAAFACLLVLEGAVAGAAIGAVKGHGIGIGFFNGAGPGAIAGTIVALHLLNSTDRNYSLFKVASIIAEKGFTNWAMSISESVVYTEIADVDGGDGVRGLSKESLQKLAVYELKKSPAAAHVISCAICLQDFKGGEFGRRLPNCGHLFHMGCIDQWLCLHGSCPICRKLCL